MKLSTRRGWIDSSGIRKVFDLAAKMKDPINLSIGQPDFDVPESVKDSLIQAVKSGKNRYTLTAGIPELKEAVANHYRAKGIAFEDVIITSGTSGGLFLSLLGLMDPGDGVMFTDPYFVMYKHLVKFLGGEPLYIDTYPHFHLTREMLEAAWKPNARILIINSPNNPTGIVYSEAECKMAAEFAKERDLVLISDEIYDRFCFDGELHTPAKFHDSPVILSGLSKSVGMTGWRIGWAAGPRDLIQAMTEIQQYTFVCAPSIAQEAALEALKFDGSHILEDYTHRRDLIYNGLLERGFEVSKPGGAFYIFPAAPSGDGDAFVKEAIENNLLVVPGSVFSEKKSHFRISFAATEGTLNAGLDVLGRLAKKHGQLAGA